MEPLGTQLEPMGECRGGNRECERLNGGTVETRPRVRPRLSRGLSSRVGGHRIRPAGSKRPSCRIY